MYIKSKNIRHRAWHEVRVMGHRDDFVTMSSDCSFLGTPHPPHRVNRSHPGKWRASKSADFTKVFHTFSVPSGSRSDLNFKMVPEISKSSQYGATGLNFDRKSNQIGPAWANIDPNSSQYGATWMNLDRKSSQIRPSWANIKQISIPNRFKIEAYERI